MKTITISTTKSNLTIQGTPIRTEAPGVYFFDLTEIQYKIFKNNYSKNNYFKRCEENGTLKVKFEEITQDIIEKDFNEIGDKLKAKDNQSELLGLDTQEIIDIYNDEVKNKIGKKSTKTLIKEIIKARGGRK